MTTLLTGGTGWIGSRVAKRLDDIAIVTRDAARVRQRGEFSRARLIECDLNAETIGRDALQGMTSVVNLMGEGIADGRWSEEKKKRIRDSRVKGTSNLVESLLRAERPPAVFVSASAVGYYGDRGDHICTETDRPGEGFLPDVCVAWERTAQPLVDAGVRVVWLRIGIVLGRDGGAMEKMLLPFRAGVGGRLGSGQQWMSWIHVQDLVELFLFALNHDKLRGPVNAVAPQPVRNIEFTRSLGKALHRPTVLPVPKFMLRVVLGEFANWLVASQRVEPQAATRSGFQWQYPTIEAAWQQIVGSNE